MLRGARLSRDPLFSLGLDTSSQIGLMILTAGAALAAAPPLSLLCLPLLFAAGMTLGDTSNRALMLTVCSSAPRSAARKITDDLVITGVGIASGLLVGVLAAAALLAERTGVRSPVLAGIASADPQHAGYLLAGLFVIIFVVARLLRRRQGHER